MNKKYIIYKHNIMKTNNKCYLIILLISVIVKVTLILGWGTVYLYKTEILKLGMSRNISKKTSFTVDNFRNKAFSLSLINFSSEKLLQHIHISLNYSTMKCVNGSIFILLWFRMISTLLSFVSCLQDTS